MTERPAGSSRGLPSPEQVIELLGGEFARAGYEVDDVRIDTHGRPARVVVVADGDRPLDLDTVAALSRAASALLDPLDTEPYLLEVTSPGVDRPLTTEKHFRRARGRKVQAELADGSAVTGRVAVVGDGAVDLVVRDGREWSIRRLPLGDIRKAVVQVEFSPPSAAELELVSGSPGGRHEEADE